MIHPRFKWLGEFEVNEFLLFFLTFMKEVSCAIYHDSRPNLQVVGLFGMALVFKTQFGIVGVFRHM